jgi:hypothetical protein
MVTAIGSTLTVTPAMGDAKAGATHAINTMHADKAGNKMYRDDGF